MSYLKKYFSEVAEQNRTSAAIAYMASLDAVEEAYPLVAQSIIQELKDQRKYLKLIASENYSSLPVQLAMGNLLTDKYSEGYVAHRFYAGCDNVDVIEAAAIDWAKKIFGAEHAYVQPHSGVDANLVAFWAILCQRVQSKEIERLGKKTIDELSLEEYERVRQLLVNQKVMGMALGSGGHLTHGYRHNISSKMMHSVSYEVDPGTGLIDYGALEAQVKKEKPLILIAGYSAYPRLINFAKMREIADSVGAVLMVDMAHFAGLVAGKVMQGDFNPVPFAHIVTTTTHKTLREPRGGIILTRESEEIAKKIDKSIFPGIQGGPHMHTIAAKAVAFGEALTPAFAEYCQQILKNAKAMEAVLHREKIRMIGGGTDNHLILADVFGSLGVTGKEAQTVLDEVGITLNMNSIAGDTRKPLDPSGIRFGTPAITTRGFKEAECARVAELMLETLRNKDDAAKKKMIKEEVVALAGQFPIPESFV